MWNINKLLLNVCCLVGGFSFLLFVITSMVTGVLFALSLIALGV